MSKNARADETVVHGAATTSTSVRTTIPAFISSSMDIQKGDRLRWRIEDDKLVIEIIKSPENDTEKSK